MSSTPPHPALAIAHGLYCERSRITHRLEIFDLPALRRLADVLDTLSDDDVRRVAVFAESLAMWPGDDSGSNDGKSTQTEAPGEGDAGA